MEKTTRERLTGAVIFFAALGVAVPELLNRPGDRMVPDDASAVAEAGPPLNTYDIAIDPAAARDAAGQQALGADSAARSEAIAQAVPPPVIEPVRGPAPPPPAATVAAPAVNPEASAPTLAGRNTSPAAAAPAAVQRPATAGAAGNWWVQLGSFSSEANAQRLARELRAGGFAVELSKVTAGGRDLHRVRAGPAADRDAATALRARLAAAGQQGALVPP